MDQVRCPNGSLVTISLETPHRGRIVVQEGGMHRVLLECDHDHPTGAEASACAGEEVRGRWADPREPVSRRGHRHLLVGVALGDLADQFTGADHHVGLTALVDGARRGPSSSHRA